MRAEENSYETAKRQRRMHIKEELEK